MFKPCARAAEVILFVPSHILFLFSIFYHISFKHLSKNVDKDKKKIKIDLVKYQNKNAIFSTAQIYILNLKASKKQLKENHILVKLVTTSDEGSQVRYYFVLKPSLVLQ